MEKQLTYLEAWVDFWQWIRQPEQQRRWADIDRKVKQYLYKANIDYNSNRLGYERTKNILMEHATDRYDFREAVILKDNG